MFLPVLSLALLLASAGAGAETMTGQVVRVADGDTVTVLSQDGQTHQVRLAGIDAPERAQPFGQRARQQMSALVFGKPVVVEWSKRDRYQRIVGKVLVADRDTGLALVASGLAWHFKRYQHEQSAADRAQYAAAEEQARSSGKGLWSEAHPVPPWEWRAAKRQGAPGNLSGGSRAIIRSDTGGCDATRV